MHADVPNHEPSFLLMNCGEPRQIRPSMGSWVTYGLGTENQNLPGFVAMCPGGFPLQENQNWQSGFLPGVFQGTYVDSKHTDVEKLVEFVKNKATTKADQRKQLDLLAKLNGMHQTERPNDPQLEARIQSFELASRMQTEASDAFDVTKEPKHVLEAYGPGEQARSLLLARRLVERGVRFVQVSHGPVQPWDSHDDLEKEHKRLAGQVDRPIAALIADLKRLGLFDSTLILWGGEFGRTPVVELPTPGSNAGKINGRDHNHWGFSVWLAGGGVKGGQAVGATDEFGFKAVEQPIHVHDLHATMLHLLGFDHEKFTYRYAGRDFRLTDVQRQGGEGRAGVGRVPRLPHNSPAGVLSRPVGGVHLCDPLARLDRRHKVGVRTDVGVEVGVADADRLRLVRVAVPQLRELGVLLEQLRGLRPQGRVHVVGHHLDPVEFGLLLLQ